jgi:hypothetical protein
MPELDPNVRKAIELCNGDPDNLGCVMLEVELPNTYRLVLDDKWAYHSETQSYIKGYEGKTHVTLLYGLLFSAKEHQDIVDTALNGWRAPGILPFYQPAVFRGDDDGVSYSCLILKPEERDRDWANDELADANARLSKLPHVRGFVDYDPHVTIGYVRREFEQEALEELEMIVPRPLITRSLDYGD